MRIITGLTAAAALLLASGQAQAQQQTSPTAVAGVDAAHVAPRTRREIVLDAIRRNQGGSDRLFAAPNIPAKVVQGARESGRLGANEELLGVSDGTVARNGRIGLYFLADRIVQKRAVDRTEIYYEQLRGVAPKQGAFVIHYGDILIDANLVGKDRIAAVIADILKSIETETAAP
jgi:outer membrane receptor protein involved in Fe transport